MEMIGGRGMEGIYFYWLFWLFWILSSFFMNRGQKRFKISLCLLIAIILSVNSVNLLNFEISMTTVFVLLVTYSAIAKQTTGRRLYVIITSFIVMISYATFLLFELYDPVWVILDRSWLLAALLAYLVIIMHEHTEQRVISLIAGVIHGDVLYSILLRKFSFPYTIGSMQFLDVMALCLAFLLIISGFNFVSVFFEQYFSQQEGEKQKQS